MKFILFAFVICFAAINAAKVSKTVFEFNPKQVTEVIAKRFAQSNFDFSKLNSHEDHELTSVVRHELLHNGVFDGYQDTNMNVLVSSAVQGSTKSKVQDKVSNKTADVSTNSKGDLKLDLFGKCTKDSDFVGLVMNYTINSNVQTDNGTIDVAEKIGLGYFLKIQKILAKDVEHELAFIAPDEVSGVHVIRATGSSVVSQTVSLKDYDKKYLQKSMGQALIVGVKSDGDEECKSCGGVKVFATAGAKTTVTETVKGKKMSYTIGSVDSSISVIKRSSKLL